MSTGFVTTTLFCAVLVNVGAAAAQAAAPCDPRLVPSELTPAYGARDTDESVCYGYYESTVSSPSLELLGFSTGGSFLDTEGLNCLVVVGEEGRLHDHSSECLVMTAGSAPIETHPLRIRGVPKARMTYYQLDAVLNGANDVIEWPGDGRSRNGIAAGELGFFGWFPSEHTVPRYFWPVELVGRSDPELLSTAEILIRSDRRLVALVWRLRCAGDDMADSPYTEVPDPGLFGRVTSFRIPQYQERVAACSGNGLLELIAQERDRDYGLRASFEIGVPD